MKKLLFFKKAFLLVMFCLSVTTVKSQSSANVNDVMLHSFGWDVHTQPSVVAEGGLYNYLNNRAASYAAAGFNVIWLPPPSKSLGGVGYIPTELFNFTQTSYGSEAQLRTLLTTLNSSTPKIHPMADIVVNHRAGSTNWTDFTNPTWDCKSITNTDEANFTTITGIKPCGNADTGEDFNGARDLDHTNIQVQNGVKEYLSRLKALGFDSWRWDVAKGFSANYFGDYVSASAPYASVGEYWDGSINNVKAWIDGAGKKSAAFDFPLYYSALQPAFNNGNYGVLANNPGLTGQFGYADKSVTFVDNHDTFVKPGSFTSNDNIMKAYAYILTHPGMPSVYFPHYHGGTYKKDGVTVVYTSNEVAIKNILAVRKSNGINAYSSVLVSNSGSFYSATIDNKVAVKIGPGTWNPGTGWTLKTSGTDYAIWDKAVVDVPSLAISQTGGTFATGSTVNVVLTANKNTSSIYYTTDGSTPTSTSMRAVGSITLSITANTTLKAFVKNTENTNSAVITEVYSFGTAQPFTVYFKKPTNWNAAVKIYYWGTTGTAQAVTWPGVAMTADCGDWYKFTFPSTVSASNLIFNDGTLKTIDLSTTAGIKYFDGSWLNAEPANRCPGISPDLTISPVGGNFTTGTNVNVVMTANVNNSTIYYTLNGATPTTNSSSAIGNKSIIISSNTTLKAFVVNASGIASSIKTEIYNFSSLPTLTVYFKPPSNWSGTPKVHYWNAVPTGSVANTTWPGLNMTAHTNGFYKYTITGPTSINLIFNNGSGGAANQTADLLNKTNGYSYTWGASTAKMSTSKEESNAEITMIYLSPNPVSDSLYITSNSTPLNYQIASISGVVVQTGKVNNYTISMSNLSNGQYIVSVSFENGQEHQQKIVKN